MNINNIADYMNSREGQRTRAIFFSATTQEWLVRVIAACAENGCTYTTFTEEDGSVVICVNGTFKQLRACTEQLKAQMDE